MKHIAFDIGAESGRAIVGEIAEGKLHMKEIHRFPTPTVRVNESLRWDIHELFAEIKNGLKKYSQLYGDATCSMGVDTWGIDYGFLDRNGELCDIPYHYRDKRTEGTAKIIDEAMGLDTLYELTGIQQMEINTLNQLIAAKRDHDSVLDSGEKLLFIGDLLHYFLCGSVKSEYSIATTSNLFSTISDSWCDEVIEAFGFNRRNLPEVVPAGSLLGTIKPDLAQEVGLSKTCTVIAPPVHDTACAATAVPSQEENVAFISTGTWSLVGLERKGAVANEKAKANNIANYGSAFGNKIFIKNVMGLWLIQQARHHWLKKRPDLSYGEIVELAKEARPFYGLIDPNDAAFLNPKNMPAEISAYLNRSGQKTVDPDDIGQVARIIFESLSLAYRRMFAMLTDASGFDLTQINMIGGGIQNKMLTQYTANATGVKVVAGPIEATAAGNILVQAFGTGEIASLSELRRMVSDTFEPEIYLPENTKEWDEMFRRFLSIGLKNH